MFLKNALLKKIATLGIACAALIGLTTSSAMAQSKTMRGCCLAGSLSSLPGKAYPGNFDTTWETALLQDAEEMTKLFGVRPHLFYIQENGGANAFFTPATFPDLLAAENASEREFPDGTIFIGLQLVRDEARSTQGTLFSLPAVLAHEYAHGMQDKRRFPVYGKWRELHADFLAGYFIGHRSRFASQNILQAADSLFRRGDTDFNSPDHHGTHDERLQAFTAGYQFNRRSNAPSGAAAYAAGIQYVRSQGASF